MPGFALCLAQSRGVKIVYCARQAARAGGIVKVTTKTRKEALEAAIKFLDQGMPFVTVVADGRVYTVEEFALTTINDEDGNAPRS